MSYITLALVRLNKYSENVKPELCVAKAWSVNEGDTVIVNGADIGKVIKEKSYIPDDERLEFILLAYGRTTIRGLSVITHKCGPIADPLEEDDGSDE